MSYKVKELIEIFEQEGISVTPEERTDPSFDIFPDSLFSGEIGEAEQKAVSLFLNTYRNPNYKVFYIDYLIEEENRMQEILDLLQEYPSPLSYSSPTLSYKVLTGYFASPFLFSYVNEIGGETVGILFPQILGGK